MDFGLSEEQQLLELRAQGLDWDRLKPALLEKSRLHIETY